MRLLVLLALVVLVAPSGAAVDIAPPTSPTAPGDPGGPGCTHDADGPGSTCLWMFNNTDQYQDTGRMPSPYNFYAIPVPANVVDPRSYATISVNFAGQDNGWSVGVAVSNAGRVQKSTAGHAPDNAASPTHVSTSSHVVLAPTGSTVAVYLWTSFSDTIDHRTNSTPPSVGSWRVLYHVEPLDEGVTPSRPAATAGDPQMLSRTMDAGEPDRDIRAAWFDDAALGDGLFEARLVVASLAKIDFNTTNAFAFKTNRIDWVLSFRVKQQVYDLTWIARANGAGAPDLDCALFLAATDPAATQQKVISPECEMDVQNATLVAHVPERSVGSPGPADLFVDIRARSLSYPGSDLVPQDTGSFDHTATPVQDPEDQTDAADMKYPFALGGPAVWHTLNPRLDTIIVPPPPWYVDPLAKDNIPNTLQVVGALAAGITFLVGALAVIARRRQLRKHLDRIDAVERSRRFDSSETLRELGLLEDEFARMFRKGRLTEGQFQVLGQRIASVATRFALRRELGLDDGVPGPDGPTTRVPVRDASSPPLRE